jgi:ubiquinone/menaquinone biosynthesis C-methylase UbiE
MDKGKLVSQGYDKIAERYHSERSQFEHTKELEEFMDLLPKKAKILDAGCGAGVPIAQTLASNGFSVTGIDISAGMLKLARAHVPQAKFLKKDMTKLDFADNSFNGVVSFYAIIHIPRERHSKIFQGFHRLLKPSGVMLICLGADEWEAEEEYKGVQMFWSQHAPEKALQLVKDAGFNIIWDRVLTRGGETHYWVLARNME